MRVNYGCTSLYCMGVHLCIWTLLPDLAIANKYRALNLHVAATLQWKFMRIWFQNLQNQCFNNFAIYNFFTVGNYYHKKREWGAALIPNYMKSKKCRCKCLMFRKIRKNLKVKRSPSAPVWVLRCGIDLNFKWRIFHRIMASQTRPDLIRA